MLNITAKSSIDWFFHDFSEPLCALAPTYVATFRCVGLGQLLADAGASGVGWVVCDGANRCLRIWRDPHSLRSQFLRSPVGKEVARLVLEVAS